MDKKEIGEQPLISYSTGMLAFARRSLATFEGWKLKSCQSVDCICTCLVGLLDPLKDATGLLLFQYLAHLSPQPSNLPDFKSSTSNGIKQELVLLAWSKQWVSTPC